MTDNYERNEIIVNDTWQTTMIGMKWQWTTHDRQLWAELNDREHHMTVNLCAEWKDRERHVGYTYVSRVVTLSLDVDVNFIATLQRDKR